MCVMSGSWSANGFGGGLTMRVVDASGSLVAEASARATAWVNANHTVRAAVSKIYSQLGYTGFNEDVYQRRLQREYPKRPTLATSEEAIKNSEPRNRVEGIWTDSDDRYRLGIVPAAEGSGADYVAVVLRSSSPLWQPGEIKAEIRTTATADVFTCTWYMQNKKAAGTTLTVEHNSLLRGSAISTPTGPYNLLLVRVWPKLSEETTSNAPASGMVVSGTGFLLSQGGLIATNWHVVADAKNISVAFPSWNGSAPAEVVIRDKVNDLALLRVNDPTKLATTCHDPPFQLQSSNSVTLGERVSTVGYPLTSMLGSSPKFAEGVVSSKSGWRDDPRTLQISAQVQPGSSGSPLFDSDGNIVGIVVATLDAGKVYQAASALPQNVNFAVKSDCLIESLRNAPSGRASRFSNNTFFTRKSGAVRSADTCVVASHSLTWARAFRLFPCRRALRPETAGSR
jgi:S1-C subfamily serine protease